VIPRKNEEQQQRIVTQEEFIERLSKIKFNATDRIEEAKRNRDRDLVIIKNSR